MPATSTVLSKRAIYWAGACCLVLDLPPAETVETREDRVSSGRPGRALQVAAVSSDQSSSADHRLADIRG